VFLSAFTNTINRIVCLLFLGGFPAIALFAIFQNPPAGPTPPEGQLLQLPAGFRRCRSVPLESVPQC
jgi:hypothetical protein